MNYKKIKLKDGSTIDEHRLLMEKKLERKLFSFEVVHHIDENKLNNNLDNLCIMFSWCHRHKHQVGIAKSEKTKNLISLSTKGTKNHNSFLSEEEIFEIKSLLKEGKLLQKEIALLFCVSHKLINDISCGRTYKD